jgi:hypothetical protein
MDDAAADDTRPPRWDGRSDFYEDDDEPIAKIRGIMARPPSRRHHRRTL